MISCGEASGILLYVIVPLLVGVFLVRLCIYFRMSRRGLRWNGSSPAAVSVMAGTLLLLVPLTALVMYPGVHSFEAAMTKLTLVVTAFFPILVVVGLLLIVYAIRAAEGWKNFSNFTVYALCAGSLMAEYFHLRLILSH
jgi:hypothetical protein